MKVSCSVEEIEMESEDTGRPVPGVCVTCGECGEQAEVYGTSPRSVRRGLMMLKENCPNESNNWYDAGEDGEGD